MSAAIRRRERGQSLVEFALYLPFFLGFVLVSFQIAVVLMAYLSLLNGGRDVGRWLALHPHTTDADALVALRARLPGDLVPGDLNATFSPPCPVLSAGRCPDRAIGSTLGVTLTYDAQSHFFIPTAYSTGVIGAPIPTVLPAYSLFLIVEGS